MGYGHLIVCERLKEGEKDNVYKGQRLADSS
jgi:hypothetical protein